MQIEEANRIIAEFMGSDYVEYKTYRCPVCDFSEFKAYSESLDRLVPVWEKLGRSVEYELKKDNDRFTCSLCDYGTGLVVTESYYKTIQEAACIATAKAIRELK